MAPERETEADWKTRAAVVRDPEQPAAPLPGALLLEVFQHARECYPEECCGLLLGPPGVLPTKIVRCTNVQNRRRQEGESELDARHAFWIDERELLLALRGAERDGDELRVVYHSHVDTEAYLSHADVSAVLGPSGDPLYPDVAQLVVSIYGDELRDAVCFDWDERARGYVGRSVQQVSGK